MLNQLNIPVRIYLNRFILQIIIVCNTLLLQGQYIPKVPADTIQYIADMHLIARAGKQSCIDWKFIIDGTKVTDEKLKDKEIRYDSEGKVVEINYFNKQGHPASIHILEYDYRSLPMSRTEYLPTGKIIGETKYVYDTTAFLREVVCYDAKKQKISWNKYITDVKKNTVIEEDYVLFDSLINKTAYLYTDIFVGNVEQVWYYKDEDTIGMKRIIQRSKDDKINEEAYLDQTGVLLYTTYYKYDQKGNLLEKTTGLPTGEKFPRYAIQYDIGGLKVLDMEFTLKGKISDYRKYTYD